jgi:hypothetical protein
MIKKQRFWFLVGVAGPSPQLEASATWTVLVQQLCPWRAGAVPKRNALLELEAATWLDHPGPASSVPGAKARFPGRAPARASRQGLAPFIGDCFEKPETRNQKRALRPIRRFSFDPVGMP